MRRETAADGAEPTGSRGPWLSGFACVVLLGRMAIEPRGWGLAVLLRRLPGEPSGMGVFVDLAELADGDVGVDLRRGQAGMSKEGLNKSDVGAAVEH